MKIHPAPINGLLILEPFVHGDHRGFFMETYQKERYGSVGIDCAFVQDNLSFSVQGTLRGLHYQYPHAQAKLVQLLQGEVFDVAVDIRKGSADFGKWFGIRLSQDNRLQFFIPEGFAHGFCVISPTALFAYKCTDYYSPENEKGILWSDPDIGIDWPAATPLLSDKDKAYPGLKSVPAQRLPSMPVPHNP
jgi:dTDP-4-dehydrorhamnose 3,5-epimerase